MWVLVGVTPFRKPVDYRVMGPFDTPDEARAAANLIGIPEYGWQVVQVSRFADQA